MRVSPSSNRVTGAPYEYFLSTRMPPSASRVPAIYRETTICYAYMCAYAHGCTEKSARPAQVLRRRCMRYLPESMRVKPGVSDYALDLLAKRRQRGKPVSRTTARILDELRPNGPIRRQV
jgi:hypothetical protein